MEAPEVCQEWDKKNWTEIRVVDSEAIYEERSLKSGFLITLFTDRAEELARFLWALKGKNELLEIKT